MITKQVEGGPFLYRLLKGCIVLYLSVWVLKDRYRTVDLALFELSCGRWIDSSHVTCGGVSVKLHIKLREPLKFDGQIRMH